MNYPDCKDANSFDSGMEFQDFVCCELAKQGIVLQNLASKKMQFEVGENLQGFEIKLDRRCTDTGRLSIEVAEKSHAGMPNYTPSGIYRKDNTWLYIQGNYKRLYIFGVGFLRRLYESGKMGENTQPTIKAFFLPLDKADIYCLKRMDF